MIRTQFLSTTNMQEFKVWLSDFAKSHKVVQVSHSICKLGDRARGGTITQYTAVILYEED